jgi:hypothetical protein
MESSWGDFGCPKPFQGSCKFHEHIVFFYLSVLYEGSSPSLGRVNRIDMLGVLNALPFGLLGYAIEYRVILFMVLGSRRHISILIGARAPLSGAVLKRHLK